MVVPEKISSAAQRLKEGHRINRITVRDFLRHFGAERRGAAKVQAIRTILDLQTEPDFATAWIDGLIWLRLKEGTPIAQAAPTSIDGPGSDLKSKDLEEIVLESTPSAVKQAEEQAEAALTSSEPDTPNSGEAVQNSSMDDPTFRIGSLPAANKKLVSESKRLPNESDGAHVATRLFTIAGNARPARGERSSHLEVNRFETGIRMQM